ncbi:unnamed protein product [Chondrus crispus]|uniref:Uncharacterized protein n=1 Tax=Chondrus crispus TaxID=2769 RepID=R7Q543_CHOCR|nr:unnamed protein product [Chondrus crispus]CDF33672.1 unnamed protein product [Chondrus crispus]|eukprot:XP_005713491.1 unnamed protein product [Chondrus crispus]
MSADGKCVVSESEDKSVRMWDVETGAQLEDALTRHTGMVISFAMNVPRRRVVSGSGDGNVRVWDVETGAQVGDELNNGHTGPMASVMMNADGRRVVSACSDKMVRVWDMERGITIHFCVKEDWDDITNRFLSATDLDTISRTGRTPQKTARGKRILQWREDGSEAVLAQTDGEMCPEVAQIDHNHGVVVAGMDMMPRGPVDLPVMGEVALMRSFVWSVGGLELANWSKSRVETQ